MNELESIQNDLSTTAEIKLYYDLYVPEGIGEAAAPLLVAVHGYGAHKRYMMREAIGVANEQFVIASIQGPHQHFRQGKNGAYRVGFGWLTDHNSDEYVRLHHQFVLDVIDRLAADDTIDRDAVCLFGFSQACALNFRFALTHPEAVSSIIGVCGGIPGDLDTNPAYGEFAGDALYLYGDDDEFYTQEQFAAFNAKLALRLPNYTSKHYIAKHEITDEMRVDIRSFLGSQL